MEILKTIEEVKVYRDFGRKKEATLGLVPTMGALHKGHLSLVTKSISENTTTIASIFVNPIQFTHDTDLKQYPRTVDSDIDLLKNAGCSALFLPGENEMYKGKPIVTMQFGSLDTVMEGAFRPGHFSGVGIVVAKLFAIIQPTNAYFGQKDLQQFLVIQQLVKDLSIETKVHRCPILREADGLAMSSRNRRLTTENRAAASKIYESLCLAEKMLLTEGIENTKKAVRLFLAKYNELTLEYLEIVDSTTLSSIDTVEKNLPTAICIAVYLDGVRLIDNLVIE